MKMSCGRLAENDDENVSVFASHFKSVLNNNKLTDDSVINDIKQREVMTELDTPPKWNEFKKIVTEVTNDKAPGLNEIPPNAFKDMSDKPLCHHFSFIAEFYERTFILKSGTKNK